MHKNVDKNSERRPLSRPRRRRDNNIKTNVKETRCDLRYA